MFPDEKCLSGATQVASGNLFLIILYYIFTATNVDDCKPHVNFNQAKIWLWCFFNLRKLFPSQMQPFLEIKMRRFHFWLKSDSFGSLDPT